MAFTPDEIDDAFAVYQRHVRNADWSAWADLFVDEVVYLEHEHGTFYGRDALRAWMLESMRATRGTSFPVEWHVIDGERVIWYYWVQFPQLPGHAASDFQFACISILRYAGDGRWASQEDVYNAREAEAVFADYVQAADVAGVDLDAVEP